MLIKVLKIGSIASLFLILVGGSVYILARPTETRADNLAGAGSSYTVAERGQGNRVVAQESDRHRASGPIGEGRGADSELAGQGLGTQSQWADAEQPAWETVQGRVTDAGHDLLVEIPGKGEILAGLGPEFYCEERSSRISEGDGVVVHGCHEDGEFKAGTVRNLATGIEIGLRDASTGRPMWSGSGNNRNRP